MSSKLTKDKDKKKKKIKIRGGGGEGEVEISQDDIKLELQEENLINVKNLEDLKKYLDIRITKSDVIINPDGTEPKNKNDIFKLSNYTMLCIDDSKKGKYYPPEFKILCEVFKYDYEENDGVSETISNKIKQNLKITFNNYNKKEQIYEVIDNLYFLDTKIPKTVDELTNLQSEEIKEVDNYIDENKDKKIFDNEKIEQYSIAVYLNENMSYFNPYEQNQLKTILEQAIHGNFKKRYKNLKEFKKEIDKVKSKQKTYLIPVFTD